MRIDWSRLFSKRIGAFKNKTDTPEFPANQIISVANAAACTDEDIHLSILADTHDAKIEKYGSTGIDYNTTPNIDNRELRLLIEAFQTYYHKNKTVFQVKTASAQGEELTNSQICIIRDNPMIFFEARLNTRFLLWIWIVEAVDELFQREKCEALPVPVVIGFVRDRFKTNSCNAKALFEVINDGNGYNGDNVKYSVFLRAKMRIEMFHKNALDSISQQAIPTGSEGIKAKIPNEIMERYLHTDFDRTNQGFALIDRVIWLTEVLSINSILNLTKFNDYLDELRTSNTIADFPQIIDLRIHSTYCQLSIGCLTLLGIPRRLAEMLRDRGCTRIEDLGEERYLNILNSILEDQYKRATNTDEVVATINSIQLLARPFCEIWKDDIDEIFKKRGNIDRNYHILLLRSQGRTLSEIGELESLTRERVRQIDMRFCTSISRKISHLQKRYHLLYRLETERYLISEEAGIFVFGDALWSIVKHALLDGDVLPKELFYWKEANLYLINAQPMLDEILEEGEAIIEENSNDNTSIGLIVDIFNRRGFSFVTREIVEKHYTARGYKWLGNTLHQGRLSIGSAIIHLFEQEITEPIHISDEKQLLGLAEALKAMGIEQPSSRALVARITSSLTLCDRGTYCHPSKLHIEQSLLTDIVCYVEQSGKVFYDVLYTRFAARLASESNVHNYNALHGVLSRDYSEKFDFSKDFVQIRTQETYCHVDLKPASVISDDIVSPQKVSLWKPGLVCNMHRIRPIRLQLYNTVYDILGWRQAVVKLYSLLFDKYQSILEDKTNRQVWSERFNTIIDSSINDANGSCHYIDNSSNGNANQLSGYITSICEVCGISSNDLVITLDQPIEILNSIDNDDICKDVDSVDQDTDESGMQPESCNASFSTLVEKCLQEANEPMTYEEISESVGSPNIQRISACVYQSKNIMRLAGKRLMHRDTLLLDNSDIEKLHNTLITDFEETGGYSSHYRIWNRLGMSMAMTFEENFIETSEDLYYLMALLFSSEHSFQSPHIMREPGTLYTNANLVRDCVPTGPFQRGELLEAVNQRLGCSGNPGLYSAVMEYCRSIYQLDEDLHLNISAFTPTKSILQDMETAIEQSINTLGFVLADSIHLERKLPVIRYAWTPYFVRDIIRFHSNKVIAITQDDNIRLDTFQTFIVIGHTNIRSWAQLINSVIARYQTSHSSLSIPEWMIEQYARCPKCLIDACANRMV